MSLGSFLFGKKEKMQRHSTMSPDQIGASTSFLKQAQEGMQNPYAGFDPIEQQARSNYQQSIPSLMERFTSLSPTSQRSSGFQSALGRAGTGLEESLAAMKANYGLQNRGQMMNLGQMGMQPRFENMFRPATGGLFGQLAGPLAQAGLGMATGGMMGAGMFGKGAMNNYNQGGMNSLLPLLMMMGGQQ
jgi:hypothetical protein